MKQLSNPSDRWLLLGLLLSVPLWGAVAFGQLPQPLIDVNAALLPTGAITDPIPNQGSVVGNFTTDSTAVQVVNLNGRNALEFTGSNRLRADFATPPVLAGNGSYTVVAKVLNPVIANEEAYLTWSRRFPAGGFNAAQFNYGGSPGFGAVTHWGSPDMGFASLPVANRWQTLVITYDGSTEKVYVNGTLDSQEAKTLNHHSGDPFMIGCSYNFLGTNGALQTELGFTGQLSSVQVYGVALSETQVREASGFVLMSGQVTYQGVPMERVAVHYATSPNPSAAPEGTALTNSNGQYAMAVPQQAGLVYVAAAADGYEVSADSQVTVADTDISGVDLAVGALQAPLVDLDASVFATNDVITAWSNSGSLQGSFLPDGTEVRANDVGGRRAVVFTGANRMKADFNAPATITGSSGFTVLALLYNPAIALEEAYLTWAQRGTIARCGQFNYGNSPAFGAAAHWGDVADIGFAALPPAGRWHWIAMTYDGQTQRIFVNGTPDRVEAKTLDLWPNQPLVLGASYGDAAATQFGQYFSGSIAALKIFGAALTQSQIASVIGTVAISGTVTSNGAPVAGATVAYSLSPSPFEAPLGTALTDANGNYSIGVNPNSGPYYIAASKVGFFTTAEYSPAPTVQNNDVTGISLTMEARPSISGTIRNGENQLLPNAAITLNSGFEAGSELILTPIETVYSAADGRYLAYVDKDTTYYLTVRKSTHTEPTAVALPIAQASVTQDFTLTRLATKLLVDLRAADLGLGGKTVADTWANQGELGGHFTASANYSVSNVDQRPSVDFVSNTNLSFTSSRTTDQVAWPSSLAGSGDIQYTVTAWLKAPASTGTFLSFSGGTASMAGRTFNSSWMFFRYNNDVAWGAADHGLSNWIGWTGVNTTSPLSFPAVNQWHMITHTYDGKSQSLYVNGVKQSTPASEAILRTFNPSANTLVLGRNHFGGDFFSGYLHRVQVYDQALAAAQVADLFAAGNVVGSGYDQWLSAYASLTGANRSPDADPDGDGVPNGIEFLTGTAPDQASSRQLPVSSVDASGNLVLSFQRAVAAEAFAVIVEHSETLQAPWAEIAVPVNAVAGPPVTVVDGGNNPDQITVVVPGAPAQRKFARVKIAIPFTP